VIRFKVTGRQQACFAKFRSPKWDNPPDLFYNLGPPPCSGGVWFPQAQVTDGPPVQQHTLRPFPCAARMLLLCISDGADRKAPGRSRRPARAVQVKPRVSRQVTSGQRRVRPPIPPIRRERVCPPPIRRDLGGCLEVTSA
jgi:hypothetical protein